MPRIIHSLDAHGMQALLEGHYQNTSAIPTKDLLLTVKSILADVEREYSDDAGLARIDFFDDGLLDVLASS